MFYSIKQNLKLTLIVLITIALSACSSGGSDEPSALATSPTNQDNNQKPTTPIQQAKASVFGNINGNGILRFSGQNDCNVSCQREYDRDSQVTITAVADSGYEFANWEGACSGSSNTCSLNLNDNKVVSASFVKTKRTLSLSNNGEGSISVSANGTSCVRDCNMSFDQGKTIILVATANTGHTFKGWSGDTCSGTAPCTIKLNENMSVTANYEAPTGGGNTGGGNTGNEDTYYQINAKVAYGQGGYIAKINNGNCDSECSEQQREGSNISLTATAYEGYEFDRWSGACTTTSAECRFTLNKNESVTATFRRVKHMAYVRIVGSGSLKTFDIAYNQNINLPLDHGTELTVEATPDEGYRFKQWSGACTGSIPQCNVTITKPQTLQAEFVIIRNTLTTQIVGEGSVSGTNVSCESASCTSTHDYGTQITLTATAKNGYEFAGWTGQCEGKDTCKIKMDQRRNVTANFTKEAESILTAKVVGEGAISGLKQTCDSSDCSSTYSKGTLVTLTATPSAGYEFAGWTGACSGTSTCKLTMDQSLSVTANFTREAENILTASIIGNGTISGLTQACNSGTCSGTYAKGTVVTLTATPSDGYEFAGWTGDCEGASTCKVTMDQSRTVTANFTKEAEYILIAKIEGQGSISGLTEACTSGSCSSIYAKDTAVTLTATAKSGYEFTGWSGACSGTGTCSVTMSQSRSVTANFTPESGFILTAKIVGNGAISGLTQACNSGTCSSTYDKGASVTLTATPSDGYEFAGWTGDCEGASTCKVTMDQSRTVTANFTKEAEYILIAKIEGQGSISGLTDACTSGSCSSIYAKDTTVTLTATAKSGYEFTGWSGACSGTSTCSVTMSQSRSVTANFTPESGFILTAKIVGNGAISGLTQACNSGTCSSTYDKGTSVTLTATPEQGYEFVGWTGKCEGVSTCKVTMDQSHTVTANFTKEAEYILIAKIEGEGSISGLSDTCNSGSCSSIYAKDTTVTLTATAKSGYEFTGWTGDCSGTSTCRVTMDKAHTVTATFTKSAVKTYTLTIPAIQGGSLNVDINGDFVALCGTDICNLTVSVGDTVKLTAQLDTDYKVEQWTDACSATAASQSDCSLVISGDVQAGIKVTAIQKATHQATVSWDIPDSRENGDDLQLSEIGGYEIRYKHANEDQFKSIVINDSQQREVIIKDLVDGQYQFIVASFDTEGLYSDYSDPAYKTF